MIRIKIIKKTKALARNLVHLSVIANYMFQTALFYRSKTTTYQGLFRRPSRSEVFF